MKERSRIDNIVSSKFYPLLLFFVSFVFVMLFSRSTSFLYVFEGGDPAIFKQMGLAMLRGKTLYIDYFDNKGCILYFIQALGLWLGGDFFILLMQTVSLTITLVIWDKMLALYRDGRSRLICLGVALVLLLCFYQDGDLTEEWCLPFASYPLLMYFQSLKSGKAILPIRVFVIGFCFGIITFIRINNAVPFLGFLAWYWVQLLVDKDFKKLFRDIILFLTGFLIVAATCVFYFYFKVGWQGVDEMFYATFLFNFDYIGVKGTHKIPSLILYFLFISLCILQQIINSRKDKPILIPSLISYGLFIVSFGTRCFTHYLMALLPLLVVLFMTTKQEMKRKPILIALPLMAALFYLPIPLALAVNDLVLKNDKYSVIYEDFHHCIEDIPEAERDSIYNYNLHGNAAGMMQHEKLLQCNRVFFSSFVFHYKRLYKEETEKPFYSPKWIIISWDRYFTDDDARFVISNYDLYCEFCHDRMYFNKPKIGQKFQVYLYCRKD